MEHSPWFKDWFNSHYYHLLYQHRDMEEANAFIVTLINYLKPVKGSTVLDIACGKGRHSIALAEMGFDVTGIDLSAESITEAKTHEFEKLHFFEHDMRLPFRKNYFNYAFNFFTSFGYFVTREEHDQAIQSMAKSIVNGGILVIDYLNVQYAEQQDGPIFTKTIGDVHFHINKWHDDFHFFKQIKITDAENEQPKYLYTERVAKFGLDDFSEMLSSANMKIVQVFGDYLLNKFDVQNSPRLIVLAQKLID